MSAEPSQAFAPWRQNPHWITLVSLDINFSSGPNDQLRRLKHGKSEQEMQLPTPFLTRSFIRLAAHTIRPHLWTTGLITEWRRAGWLSSERATGQSHCDRCFIRLSVKDDWRWDAMRSNTCVDSICWGSPFSSKLKAGNDLTTALLISLFQLRNLIRAAA